MVCFQRLMEVRCEMSRCAVGNDPNNTATFLQSCMAIHKFDTDIEICLNDPHMALASQSGT